MIKPGTICYLVNLPLRTEYNGRVVTFLGPSDEFPGRYAFTAPWAVEYVASVGMHGHHCATLLRCFLPINDPDEPVTTHTPEELTA